MVIVPPLKTSALTVELGTTPPLQSVATDQSPCWTFQVTSARAGGGKSSRTAAAAAQPRNWIGDRMRAFSKGSLHFAPLLQPRQALWQGGVWQSCPPRFRPLYGAGWASGEKLLQLAHGLRPGCRNPAVVLCFLLPGHPVARGDLGRGTTPGSRVTTETPENTEKE